MMRRFVLIFTVVAAAACASGQSRVLRDSNTITAEEVAASHESNAFDVVNKLRPSFLRSRGRTTLNNAVSEFPSVFVDGRFYGNLNSLRTIVAPQIKQIRFLSGPDAVTRFGMQYGSGAIDVTTM